jgi:hypothetical protein
MVEFRAEGDVLLQESIATDRAHAVALLEGTLPSVSREYAGQVKVVLHGPDGTRVEGDEALAGARLTRYRDEDRVLWASTAPPSWAGS